MMSDQAPTKTTKRNRSKPHANGNGTPALDIQIDIDAMTWEDMRILMSAQESKLTSAAVLEVAGLFDRVVVGGAKAVPVMRTMEVLNAIGEAMKGLGNPKALT